MLWNIGEDVGEVAWHLCDVQAHPLQKDVQHMGGWVIKEDICTYPLL